MRAWTGCCQAAFWCSRTSLSIPLMTSRKPSAWRGVRAKVRRVRTQQTRLFADPIGWRFLCRVAGRSPRGDRPPVALFAAVGPRRFGRTATARRQHNDWRRPVGRSSGCATDQSGRFGRGDDAVRLVARGRADAERRARLALGDCFVIIDSVFSNRADGVCSPVAWRCIARRGGAFARLAHQREPRGARAAPCGDAPRGTGADAGAAWWSSSVGSSSDHRGARLRRSGSTARRAQHA